MDEFQLIKRYFSGLNHLADSQGLSGVGVEVGIGDDCAVLSVPQDKQLVLSMDTLVEGAHFFPSSASDDIAERALSVSISDLAAMGAQPKWFTLALTLPNLDKDWLHGFSKGLHRAIKQYGICLIGGDTTRGPLTITVQVHGCVDKGKAITRSGAKHGDSIYVTGALGDGAASLAMLKGELDVDMVAREYFENRFYRPQAQIRAGIILSAFASSAIDISDGLIADLGHICLASDVGAVVDEKSIPISDALMKNAAAAQRLSWALSGGDDYQLCFTVPPDREPELNRTFANENLNFYKIGQVVSGVGVVSAQTKTRFDAHAGGYSHF